MKNMSRGHGRAMRSGPSLLIALAVFVLAANGAAFADGVQDNLDRPAVLSRHAVQNVLLDIAPAGDRLVAVGERGVVIWSDDLGKRWHQAEVPTSVTLTAVSFPTAAKGWSVGHAGMVLHTEDGGQTWLKQLDGAGAAKIAYRAAEAEAHSADPENKKAQRRLAEMQRLVDDGPDKPFLDVYFEDEKQGFIVGAYNLIFHTQDGGRSWQSWMDRMDNPRGLHLYAIQVVGPAVYLAGEQGLFLRSLDSGKTFERLDTPYQGTYFSLAADTTGQVMLVGLRGNAYRSGDRGKTFQRAAVPITASLNAIARADDGTLYFGNQAGLVLVSRDQGRSLQPLADRRLPPIAALIPVGEQSLFTVGWGGVIPVSLKRDDTQGGRP